jgi:Holliday junction DNA helicase RuvA
MIGRLSGLLLDARPDEVLLDVSGVGYRVHIPLSTFYRLSPPPPGPIALHVQTHVREDAIQLFGFWTAAERQAFLRLIAISGIGPRLALAVLSGIGAEDLDRAVRDADRGMLERIPGIGRKTAERMLLELRDGLEPKRRGRTAREAPPAPPPASPGPDSDALSALVNLGYPEPAAASAVAAARRDLGDGAGLEDLLRGSLRALVR